MYYVTFGLLFSNFGLPSLKGSNHYSLPNKIRCLNSYTY